MNNQKTSHITKKYSINSRISNNNSPKVLFKLNLSIIHALLVINKFKEDSITL